MESKISKFLSSLFSNVAEFGENGEKIESIVNSCNTKEQLESCRNIVSNTIEQMRFKTDRFMNDYKLINFFTFGEVRKFLHNWVDNCSFYFNNMISEKEKTF